MTIATPFTRLRAAAPAPVPVTIDRLAPLARPAGQAVGFQRWQSVLFAHWALPPDTIRPLVPERLSLDTFAGWAYVSATLFTVTDARLRRHSWFPAMPSHHELSLRTYVHLDGEAPGLWFFSTDATSLTACALARGALQLPYHWCQATRRQHGDDHRFEATRVQLGRPPPRLSTEWKPMGAPLETPPGSLEHFLTQRHYTYARAAMGKLWRQQLHHGPWHLFRAQVSELKQNLDELLNLPFLSRRPQAYYSPGVDVEHFGQQLV
ncbi:MAG: DUF2071 domain-containing protein [Archangiaceae bacterium]|nr:DUF2071 domain-containing protein [Archangiaceae bacterium]